VKRLVSNYLKISLTTVLTKLFYLV